MQANTYDDARSILQEIEEIRAETRHALKTCNWPWLLVWSLVFLGAALSVLIPVLNPIASNYWIGAVPVALVITGVLDWRSSTRTGVRRKATPYWVIGAGMTVFGFGSSALLPGSVTVVAIWVFMGAGFAGFLWLDGYRKASSVLAHMAAFTALVGLFGSDPLMLYSILGITYAAVMATIAVGIKFELVR